MDTCFTMTSLFSRRVQWHFAEERIGNLQKILAEFNGPGLISKGVIIENNTLNCSTQGYDFEADNSTTFKVYSCRSLTSSTHSLLNLQLKLNKVTWRLFKVCCSEGSWMTQTHRGYLQLGEYTTNRSGNRSLKCYTSIESFFYYFITTVETFINYHIE